MEKKDWRERLFKYYRDALRDKDTDNKIAEEVVIGRIEQKLDKAREEGYGEAVRDIARGFEYSEMNEVASRVIEQNIDLFKGVGEQVLKLMSEDSAQKKSNDVANLTNTNNGD